MVSVEDHAICVKDNRAEAKLIHGLHTSVAMTAITPLLISAPPFSDVTGSHAAFFRRGLYMQSRALVACL
jgi:hypothetical protein